MTRIFGLLFPVLLLTTPAPAQDTTPVGETGQGATLTPSYQLLRPVGQSLGWGGRPTDLMLSPDQQTLYLKDDRGLVMVDVPGWKIRQELRFPAGGGSMHGILVAPDGSRVYATTAQNLLYEAQVTPEGALRWERRITLPGPGGKGNAHPCGLTLSPDGKTLYVCLSINNTLGQVDLESGRLIRQIPVGVAPWDVVLSPDGTTAWVSNWGGRRPKRGERTAKSAGTDTLVDHRGVASSGTVSVVDLQSAREVAQIPTGLHPSDLALSPDGTLLAAANANSDTVTLIETRARRVRETISVRPDPALPFGSMPNALAFSPDGTTLYVANGGNNAVAVLRLPARGKSRIAGFFGTGWFPSGVAVTSDGQTLFVCNVKGLGSRNAPKEAGKRNVYDYLGTVDRVLVPDAPTLARWTAQVREDARVPQILKARERAQSNRKPVPVPARPGEPSVFEHVVYIIKENRTYDQVFGDLPQGNGDPGLCIFGRDVTPNHHALAEQFVLLDNFYCNGVLSADGHSWATEGNVTDHLEKTFGGFTRSYTFGDDPLTYSSSGFLWDNVLLHGLSFRNYGEMDYAEPVPRANFLTIYRDFVNRTGKIKFTQKIGIENLRRYSCREYPGWNMNIPDVLRADVFLRELKAYGRRGYWPNLIIVYLPSDHTSGLTPGAPTPRAQMADNDLALGRIVEGISRSRFWPRTCIFVVEDDPQDGFDHVDGHRSICLVISPYTRRRTVISQFYNQTSVLHTIQRILGLPPMNQMDALAPLMHACFTMTPDFRPYRALPSRVPLDELNRPLRSLRGKMRALALQSQRLPLNRVDAADEDTLNRILWHAVRGPNAPYPAHLAGAHGRGLKALRLKHAFETGTQNRRPE
ncbi:MAG: alkaline phosphatase family protein [Chloroherpetonaceae bacterium]|nr:hypothetical protein [Chthonomonadaceae bacterium]MDW8206589.1 alkaline phosphatase family protein [Chloroherpetonaceae bacterium]